MHLVILSARLGPSGSAAAARVAALIAAARRAGAETTLVTGPEIARDAGAFGRTHMIPSAVPAMPTPGEDIDDALVRAANAANGVLLTLPGALTAPDVVLVYDGPSLPEIASAFGFLAWRPSALRPRIALWLTAAHDAGWRSPAQPEFGDGVIASQIAKIPPEVQARFSIVASDAAIAGRIARPLAAAAGMQARSTVVGDPAADHGTADRLLQALAGPQALALGQRRRTRAQRRREGGVVRPLVLVQLLLSYDPDQWIGGINYTQNVIAALCALPRHERARVLLIVDGDGPEKYLPQMQALPAVLGTISADGRVLWARPLLRRLIARAERHGGFDPAALIAAVDFAFPLQTATTPLPRPVHWISDFQHLRLPQLFSDQERQNRDREFNTIVAQDTPLVVSSENARADLHVFAPNPVARPYVFRFASALEVAPGVLQRPAGVPETYLYIPNQFWIHKDHLTAFAAADQARRAGVPVHLVCTGALHDYRAAAYVERMRALMTSDGGRRFITYLGLVPRAEQVGLFRNAAAILQPSLFEGWSTVIEDCRAIGRPMILSDIPVHREQVPDGLFFTANDVGSLARVLIEVWPKLRPGPDAAAEAAAQAAMRERLPERARRLIAIAATLDGIPTPADDTWSPRKPPARGPKRAPLPIVTSIPPRVDLARQSEIVDSWRHCGFAPISINPPEEIPALAAALPQVQFVPATRDMRERYGRPLCLIVDAIEASGRVDSRHGALVNADILMLGPPHVAADAAEATGDGCSLVCRVDVDDLVERDRAEPHYAGYDLFVLSKDVTPDDPLGFAFGVPWWDYWLPFAFLFADRPLTLITNQLAWHQRHEAKWASTWYYRSGHALARWFVDTVVAPTAPAALRAFMTPERRHLLKHLVLNVEAEAAGEAALDTKLVTRIFNEEVNRYLREQAREYMIG